MAEQKVLRVRLKEPRDEFWPDVLPKGPITMVHNHASVDDEYCNNGCFVTASLEGLTEEVISE